MFPFYPKFKNIHYSLLKLLIEHFPNVFKLSTGKTTGSSNADASQLMANEFGYKALRFEDRQACTSLRPALLNVNS
jgi:hypothetical protein